MLELVFRFPDVLRYESDRSGASSFLLPGESFSISNAKAPAKCLSIGIDAKLGVKANCPLRISRAHLSGASFKIIWPHSAAERSLAPSDRDDWKGPGEKHKAFSLFAPPQATWTKAQHPIFPLLHCDAIKSVVARTFPLAKAADAEGRFFNSYI